MSDLEATSKLVCAVVFIFLAVSTSKGKKSKSKVCICVAKGIQCAKGNDSKGKKI